MVPIDFPTVLDLNRKEKQMIYQMRSNLNKEIYGGHKLDNHQSRRRRERRKRVRNIGPQANNTADQGSTINITQQESIYILQTQAEFASNSLTTLFSHLEKYWYEEGDIKWSRGSGMDNTDWKLLDFKHGQCKVVVKGENERQMRLHEAMKLIKQSKEGALKIVKWDLRESTKATEEILGRLSNKRCNLKNFHTLTDRQMRALWEHMQLMEDKQKRLRVRSRLYQVCDFKYGFTPFRKLRFKAPFSPNLRKGAYRKFVVATIQPLLEELSPSIENYILKNLKITRKKRANIGDILMNFRSHAKGGKAQCGCKYIQKKMRQQGWEPPMVDGHIAFTGAQYEGPFREVLQQNCQNTPVPDYKEDIRMARALWTQGIRKLPSKWRTKVNNSKLRPGGNLKLGAWETDQLNKAFEQTTVLSTTSHKRVRRLKHLLKSMCITPMDKNGGMLHVCCPVIYETIMDTTFDTVKNGHYEEIAPKKFCEEFAKNSYKDFKQIYYGGDGTEEDVIKYWEWFYYKQKWHKIAPFNDKGEIGQSYGLPKFKHWEPEEVAEKWRNARPISPMCKHPMSALLSATGRAWMYIIKKWKGDNFTLHAAQDIKDRVQGAIDKMRAESEDTELDLQHRIWDIESMYPSMPKGDMIKAMKTILKEVVREERLRVTHVTIPKCKSSPVRWGKQYGELDNNNSITIPLDNLVNIAKFSLEHCVTKINKGKLLRQKQGIPMGDSLSPAFAIGTCAWFEEKWLQSIPKQDRWRVEGVRYMDDVLMIINNQDWGQADKWFAAIEQVGGCYPAPLSLKQDDGQHYLECTIHNKGDDMLLQHWNKNEGDRNKQRFYKGIHAYSYNEKKNKRGAMIGNFMRMAKNSSNAELLNASLREKWNELKFLRYSDKDILEAMSVAKSRFSQFEWEHR